MAYWMVHSCYSSPYDPETLVAVTLAPTEEAARGITSLYLDYTCDELWAFTCRTHNALRIAYEMGVPLLDTEEQNGKEQRK